MQNEATICPEYGHKLNKPSAMLLQNHTSHEDV